MAAAQRPIVVGVFADTDHAEKAIRELLAAGFRKEEIAFLQRDRSAPPDESDQQTSGTGAFVGGTAGAATGVILGGVLVAAVSIAVPGFGPLLGAGMVGLMLGTAYVGGIAGALIGMGVPAAEAHAYHRAVEVGHCLVTVQARDRYSEALAILANAGALDVTREA